MSNPSAIKPGLLVNHGLVKKVSLRNLQPETEPKRIKKDRPPLSDMASDQFSGKLDLFRGPEVTILVGADPNSKKIYLIPKGLLTHASDYFVAALCGNFKEGIEQKISFDCSTIAFDFFIQYIYMGTFHSPSSFLSGPDHIKYLTEFYLMAEMFLMTDVLPTILEGLKKFLKNYLNLEPEHVRKAVEDLPSGHAIRVLFAQSSIHAYLDHIGPSEPSASSWYKPRTFKFVKEFEEMEGFAADLMKAYAHLIRTHPTTNTFKDPITGENFEF